MNASFGCFVGALAFTACGSAPAVPSPRDDLGPVGDLCSRAHAPGEPATAAKWDEVTPNFGPDAPEPEFCAPVDDCHELYVARSSNGMGSHTLVASTPSGYHVYRDLFDAGSGFACEWEPTLDLTSDGLWTIVAQKGDAYEREERECNELGVIAQFALVEVASGRVRATFGCFDSPDASLTTGPGDDEFTLADCGGLTTTFTLAKLEACWR